MLLSDQNFSMKHWTLRHGRSATIPKQYFPYNILCSQDYLSDNLQVRIKKFNVNNDHDDRKYSKTSNKSLYLHLTVKRRFKIFSRLTKELADITNLYLGTPCVQDQRLWYLLAKHYLNSKWDCARKPCRVKYLYTSVWFILLNIKEW